MTATNEARKILVLGLGELGLAIVNALLTHDSYFPTTTRITVLIRPATLTSPAQSSKATLITNLRSQGITFIPGDLETSSESSLSSLFKPYHTVIHAGAMTLPPGTQLKITRAVLATDTVGLYIPWQFGVDYDVITREGGQGMFAEQLDVRDLLRGQDRVGWVIVACGVFMSFLFEEFWGVVVRDEGGSSIERVRALGGWDRLLTATAAGDIGRCTAEVVFENGRKKTGVKNCSVYIAGDTLTYEKFVEVVERVVGHRVERELWSTDYLRKESQDDPEDKLKKYRVVFSEGKGLAWPKEGTFNMKRGIDMTGFEQYLEDTLKVS